MKHIKTYEDIEDYQQPTYKYKVGDYVKVHFLKDSEAEDIYQVFAIDDEEDDYDSKFRPYRITNSKNHYWANKDDLYTDEETKILTAQNKYNL